MKESHGEGPTTHPDPESCATGSNAQGEALTGEIAGRVLSCENRHSLGPTLLSFAEGNTRQGDHGEPCQAQAQSETPHMQGHLLHGNREAPAVSGIDVMPERAGKANGRTPAMYAVGESDAVVVPEKLPNKAPHVAAEAVEGRTATGGNADHRILRLIQKWLKAGVMEAGRWSETTQGTPQGAVISPLLANVFLHYAFDWWAKHWRKTKAQGEVYLVRYADDFVVCFERKDDGVRFLDDLEERVGSFGLELHPEKTRLIEFGRYAAERRRRRGEDRPETFNFLGFTHYCGKTKAGWPIIWRKTIAKRMTAKVKEVRQTLMQRRHDPIPSVGAWLGAVVTGYLNYHAVPGNGPGMEAFRREICRAWLSALRRRSQRTCMTWERFNVLIARWIPRPKIKHPYPWDRFEAKHPM